MLRSPLALAALMTLMCPPALTNADGAPPAGKAAQPAVEAKTVSGIPPGEDGAKAALEASPRHREWVNVAVPGSKTTIATYVAYPERSSKAPVVMVIHEIFGLTEWVRGVADQLAADGFLAVAPDMLSGKGPNGGNTDSFAAREEVIRAVRDLPAEEVRTRLDAVAQWARSQPSATVKLATIGFCWGGSQSFQYAAWQPKLTAAVVYYGTAPDTLTTINAPVLGLYGGDDARVTSTVEPTAAEMSKLGKTYVHHEYAGAGHGFLRAQGERDGANRKAAEQAWAATVAHLKKYLE